MRLNIIRKAFKEFLDVDGVNYAIVNTDEYGDCNTCVNARLVELYGVESKGIFLKHWFKGMNSEEVSFNELDEIYIAHDITEEQGNKLYDILSKYYHVEPKVYNPGKTYVLTHKYGNSIEGKVKELVENEFLTMKFSKKYSNQSILASKCQEIICKEWGFSTPEIFDLVDKYTEEFIPED